MQIEVFHLHCFPELCCTLQNNEVQHFTLQFLNLKQIKNPSDLHVNFLTQVIKGIEKKGNAPLRVV